MPSIPGLHEQRGKCGGRFSSDLNESERRVSWCGFNARLIDLPPVVKVDSILGVGLPERVAALFRGEPDEAGFFDHDEVQRCPLVQIDSRSPHFSPGWLSECSDTARAISAGLPEKWITNNPTELLIEVVSILKSEAENAANYRMEHDEEW